MCPAEPANVRTWTARHGAALRGLISAHAQFMEAVSRTRTPGSGAEEGSADSRIEAAGRQLVEAARVVQALPPVPDQPARELLDQFLASVPAMVSSRSVDRAALRARLLRSSLAMVELMDRLLPLM